MTMSEWSKEIREWGVRKGWDEALDTKEKIATKLLLVTSEITEAFEELRSGHPATHEYVGIGGKPEGFGSEVADALIRLLHLCALLGLNPDTLVETKMAYNETRPFRHNRTC